jgi:hypothetical protein
MMALSTLQFNADIVNNFISRKEALNPALHCLGRSFEASIAGSSRAAGKPTGMGIYVLDSLSPSNAGHKNPRPTLAGGLGFLVQSKVAAA